MKVKRGDPENGKKNPPAVKNSRGTDLNIQRKGNSARKLANPRE